MDKNYSYVSLLTDDTYTYGIVLLAETLKQAESKYPLYVLVTDNVSESCLEILNEIENVNYSVIDAIPIPEDIYNFNRSLDFRLGTIWKNTWTKFKIFDLTEFSKIVFLDADIMILKNLDHPNVMKIYEFLEDDKNYYLIQEFCDEGDLETALDNKKIYCEFLVRFIMYQVFLAINYLHTNNIVHQDIKKRNISIINEYIIN